MNLTEYVNSKNGIINGIKLSKAQMNLLTKLDGYGIVIPSYSETVINPVSGFYEELNPFFTFLVRWVYEVYKSYKMFQSMYYRENKVSIQTFDHVRMLILSLDSNVYSNFID
jgi:hypothetical protein